ncbi:MAG: hypothetical protein H7Z40_03980 [Phycisphaerae bacterium]|nr:hypothetical protein [Gemmatimonadaceae bacterium]
MSSSASSASGAIAGSLLPIRRAEELIATLPGVMAVRIVPNGNGEIDEIHVMSTDAVSAKQTVRNIESALMAQLGWRVNHKKISIAQSLEPSRAADTQTQESTARGSVDSTEPPAPAAENKGRRALIFDDVEVRRSRAKGLSCRVTLVRDAQTFVGEAEGPESDRSRIDLASRAAVSAVLDATRDVFGADRALSLEGAKLIDAFDREFIFVSLAARFGRDRLVLTGSAEVKDSAETSAVLAVLDATNRWMQMDK